MHGMRTIAYVVSYYQYRYCKMMLHGMQSLVIVLNVLFAVSAADVYTV